jgi:hypothetical protein
MSPKTEETMPLTNRNQAKSRQAVMAEVLRDLAENSPGQRSIRNNDFDNHPGFTPPTDNWLDNLKSIRARGGEEILAIQVKTKIEDGWVSDVYDKFEVLLVAQDLGGKQVTWRCGTVTEVP